MSLNNSRQKIKGTVVLMNRNVLDYNKILAGEVGGIFNSLSNIWGGILDALTAIFSKNIALYLISATKTDELGDGKVGKKTYLEKHLPSFPNLGERQDAFDIFFDWDESFGIPGAFYIKNFMHEEFFLVSVTLDDIPNHGNIYFDCNSWVYNAKLYKKDRIFFVNKSYLPDQTPTALVKYRTEELENLRGVGCEKGERKEHERIYDYDVYNDLGNPDTNPDLWRPVLGGSIEYPYPRRGRTNRKRTSLDSNCEAPTNRIYIPRDENFGHLKSSDFFISLIKAVIQKIMASLWGSNAEFDSFYDVRKIFGAAALHLSKDAISIAPLSKEVIRTYGEPLVHGEPPLHGELLVHGEPPLHGEPLAHGEPTLHGEPLLHFPLPRVIRDDKSAWMLDEEFAREMLAGVNPCVIQRLQEFPPKSKLDATAYGDHTCTITKEHLEVNLEGLTVEEALNGHKLFLLDYHDAFMPFLRKINHLPTAKCYATRTILFLTNDGTLMPLAIELSLPHPRGDRYGCNSRVVLPPNNEGVENTIWLLAKAYVAVNDTCYHQLMSHWLNTHATIEPFVIATNRHLSVLHPIYKLLLPHYRDTMNINALARETLINADGVIERTFLPGEYAVRMSSAVYKNWVFPDQALPADLIKRGMAIEDPSSPHGLRLVIEDYPYAVDGLEIWGAIKTWVQEYISLYYTTDDAVKQDSELQAWWKEAVEKGHGDLKDKPWWPKAETLEELIQICSIIIWIASALHAAVNFGQYPYGGLILNRPTLTRRLIPEPGSKEYAEMVENDQEAYLRTITGKNQALIDLSVIEILSRHASDEVYLGDRKNPDNWTSDHKAMGAFKMFGKKLKEIGAKIEERNSDPSLRNRNGPVKLPYTVLLPTSEEGISFRGIPNSVSI